MDELPEQQQNDEYWRDKYFDSLESLEKKEVAWQQLSEKFRNSLSKISVAGEGINPVLDRYLKQLRNNIRKGAEINELEKDIIKISSTLLKVDELRE